MAKNTKDRILEAALEIFARDGYAGTNIKDISDSIGLVKSALYRHFKSKEEIWNGVHDRVILYYEEHLGSENHLPEIPQSAGELYEMTLRMVDFLIHDRKIVLMRKLLLTEQFRDEKTRDDASFYFLYRAEAMFTKIFAAMMENGTLRKGDPRILAFSYTTPITALLHLCDRDPKAEDAVVEKLKAFVSTFICAYGISENERALCVSELHRIGIGDI